MTSDTVLKWPRKVQNQEAMLSLYAFAILNTEISFDALQKLIEELTSVSN